MPIRMVFNRPCLKTPWVDGEGWRVGREGDGEVCLVDNTRLSQGLMAKHR